MPGFPPVLSLLPRTVEENLNPLNPRDCWRCTTANDASQIEPNGL